MYRSVEDYNINLTSGGVGVKRGVYKEGREGVGRMIDMRACVVSKVSYYGFQREEGGGWMVIRNGCESQGFGIRSMRGEE